jgi:hypothetical protein
VVDCVCWEKGVEVRLCCFLDTLCRIKAGKIKHRLGSNQKIGKNNGVYILLTRDADIGNDCVAAI